MSWFLLKLCWRAGKGGGERLREGREEEKEEEEKGEEDTEIEKEQPNRPQKEMICKLHHQISQVTNLHHFPPSITLLFAPDFYP